VCRVQADSEVISRGSATLRDNLAAMGKQFQDIPAGQTMFTRELHRIFVQRFSSGGFGGSN
jgi:hypothetical protein